MALFLSVLMKSVTEVGIAYVEIMTKTINRVCSIPYVMHVIQIFLGIFPNSKMYGLSMVWLI